MPDAVYNGTGKQDHHGKPHANMEIEIPYGFLELAQSGHWQKQSRYYRIDE
jgi:hypothetical protein